MTNKNEVSQFTLVTKEDRQIVRMERTGEPFVYSSKTLAQQGKRILENARKVALLVVPA